MSIDDIELTGADDELFAGLHRSVAGATMTTSAADVVALGRRTRTRHRAVAAGVGTSMAALVAAIGVLAPSAGTGAGSGQTLKIQDAGFALEKGADGVVKLTVDQLVDPAKLKAALDKAGIKSDAQRVDLPTDWDDNAKIPDCAQTPGVRTDWKATQEVADNRRPTPNTTPKVTTFPPGAPSPVIYEFRPGQLPAGDVISVVQFVHRTSDGHTRELDMLTILTGMPDKCVLVANPNLRGPATAK